VDPVITPLARLLWKDARPAVEFFYDDQCCTVWMQLEDAERAEVRSGLVGRVSVKVGERKKRAQ
jgi:hypothetical protein